MRVLHVIPAFDPATFYGGPLVSVLAMCMALAKGGCEVGVLTTDADGPHNTIAIPRGGARLYAQNFQVRYFHRLRGSIAPGLLFALWGAISDADVIHLTSVYNFPVLPTLLFCRLQRKPLLWSPRGSLNAWHAEPKLMLKALVRRLFRAAIPTATILHATCQQEANYASAKFPAVPVVIIPNGVTVPPTVHRTDCDSRLRISYLGRLHPIKGLELLITACSQLREVPWTLTIAGAGDSAYTEQLQQLCRSVGIAELVTFAGMINGEQEKQTLFGNTDLFVLPSYSENFGLVVAEALAHGVAVVTTNRTPWRLMEEVKCGICVEPTTEGLARGIRQAASGPLLEMGQRGREWMKTAFDWNAVSADLIDVYRRLAAY